MGDVDIDYVRDASIQWLNDVLISLGCESVGDLSPVKCKVPKKEVLASWIGESLHFISDQNALIKKLRDETAALKSEVIGSQQKVIELQDQLLDCKNEQLKAVTASVENTVKAGFDSYSSSVQSAVQKELRSTWNEVAAKGNVGAITTENKLREAVKSAVVEEDKSKNVMIFGKEELPDEDVSATVIEIFQDANVKPRVVECLRVGSLGKIGKPRPIKVKLYSADAVFNILSSAKKLKSSSRNSGTYIAPDRTLEEQATHKKLVEKMKVLMTKDSSKYHYIKGGAIRSVLKTANHTNNSSE